MKNIIFYSLFFYSTSIFAQKSIIITPRTTYQTIEGFGASDCWTGNYVGQWKTTGKDNAAKFLFSQDLKSNGNPNGIGLSLWRINLGAGTAEQGDASTIEDFSRRAECFMNPDGTYNWNKQLGQQYFWKKAQEYGCENFVMFSNSPLVYFTRNGLGTSPGDWKTNLKKEHFSDFADYLATVAKYFIDKDGLNVTHISPLNEPQYQWTGGGQEGTPWRNSEIRDFVIELDKAISEKEIDTKILITEAGSWGNTLGGIGHADNQIYNFWDQKSSNFIGDLKNLDSVIGGHSYWNDTNNSTLTSVRQQVNTSAKKYDLKVYQTEWSMLSGPPIDNFPNSFDDASYMDIALHMAKVIHSDMAYTNAASWTYWTAMDVERYSHKNRFFLLRLKPSSGDYGSITDAGTVAETKTLWALGNYSLFIRPGYRRIYMSGASDVNSLMATSYISPDSSKIVSVYVNVSYDDTEIIPKVMSVGDRVPVSQICYQTNKSLNLIKRPIGDYVEGGVVTIPARSVSTIIYDYKEQTTSSLNNSLSADSYVKVFPTYTKDKIINISVPELSLNDKSKIYLMTLDGKRIYEQNIYDEYTQIELSDNLSQGVYILIYDNGETKQSTKLIIG